MGKALEPWLTMLLDPLNAEWLSMALGSFPKGQLGVLYKGCFKRSDPVAWRLVRTPWNEIGNEQVLDHLERIREERPEVLRAVVMDWLERNETGLRGLAQGMFPPTSLKAEWLQVGLWLWQQTDDSVRPSWGTTARWLAQLLDQAQQEALAKLTFSDALAEAQTRSRQLERRHEQQLKKLDTQEAALKLAKEHQAQLEHSLRTLSTRLEENQKAMQDLSQSHRTLQKQHTHTEQVLQHHRTQLYERDQEIVRHSQLQKTQQSRLEAQNIQLEQLQQEIKTLRQNLQRPKGPQGMNPGFLEQALIIDYAHLAPQPLERLVGLLELYAAFLASQPHSLLQQHTNLPDFTERAPQGLLLIGFEQMLEDATNLPLLRFLKSATFQSEALLASLLAQVRSPRLEEQS